MLIAISNPVPVADEACIINDLFDAGLHLLHVRKPTCKLSEVRKLIEAIKPEHYQKIALHNGFRLAKDYGIKRLHFNSSIRNCISPSALNAIRGTGVTLSTSVHSLKEYESLDKSFDYTFFGPVFDSISKPGYKATEQIVLPTKTTTKLVALGGINEHNCTDPILERFDKLAVLGAIWQSNDPVKTFQLIQEQWNTNDR